MVFFIIKNKSPSNLEARLMHAVFILPLAVRRSSSVFHKILQSSVDHPTLFKYFHGLSCLQLLFPIWGRRAIKKVLKIQSKIYFIILKLYLNFTGINYKYRFPAVSARSQCCLQVLTAVRSQVLALPAGRHLITTGRQLLLAGTGSSPAAHHWSAGCRVSWIRLTSRGPFQYCFLKWDDMTCNKFQGCQQDFRRGFVLEDANEFC